MYFRQNSINKGGSPLFYVYVSILPFSFQIFTRKTKLLINAWQKSKTPKGKLFNKISLKLRRVFSIFSIAEKITKWRRSGITTKKNRTSPSLIRKLKSTRFPLPFYWKLWWWVKKQKTIKIVTVKNVSLWVQDPHRKDVKKREWQHI